MALGAAWRRSRPCSWPVPLTRALHIGDSQCTTRTFTGADIASFLKCTGDANPIHVDETAAKAAGFPQRILPGILVASLFPAIIGSSFPGAVYVSQTLRFRSPARVDQPVTATVVVTKASGRRVTFATTAMQGASTVVDGEALALIPNRQSQVQGEQQG